MQTRVRRYISRRGDKASETVKAVRRNATGCQSSHLISPNKVACTRCDLYLCRCRTKKSTGKGRWKSSVQSTTNLSDKTLGFLSDSGYLDKLQNVKPGKETLFTVQERLVEKKASSKTFSSETLSTLFYLSGQGSRRRQAHCASQGSQKGQK